MAIDWKKELGIQLREGRHDLSLLQDEVAKQAKVHANMIGRYENGGSGPEIDVFIRLAVVLDKHEFQIGNYLVTIRAIDGADDADGITSGYKQLRLKYGEEYVFDSHGASMKIQPSKEGLFITPAQRKATG
jgi:transcriptional regulator with XRE-family HTH domain